MSQGYVYFFQAKNARVKIGQSTDPRRRLLDLSRHAGHRLDVIGVMPSDVPLAEEAAIHSAFAAHHIEGEWFNVACVAAIDTYRPRFLTKLPESQKLIQIWTSPEFHAACAARAKSEGRSLANWFRRELTKISGVSE
jgi:hypothetical protein